jgi:hypothetical protein
VGTLLGKRNFACHQLDFSVQHDSSADVKAGQEITKPILPMKTTVLGILTIVATLANVGVQVLKGGAPDFAAAFAAVTAGVGLIKAGDAK